MRWVHKKSWVIFGYFKTDKLSNEVHVPSIEFAICIKTIIYTEQTPKQRETGNEL